MTNKPIRCPKCNQPLTQVGQVWIIGAPSVGKSAFAANLVYYGRDKVIAVQFCEYDKPDQRYAAGKLFRH